MTDRSSERTAFKNYHAKKFFEIVSKAIPASGYRPETKYEWDRLQRANVEGHYHLYRSMGVPKAEAKNMARLIHGGPAGRLMLEIAFAEPKNEEVAS